jgi:hypothetical protein
MIPYGNAGNQESGIYIGLGMDTKVQIISSIQKYGRMRRYSKGRYL